MNMMNASSPSCSISCDFQITSIAIIFAYNNDCRPTATTTFLTLILNQFTQGLSSHVGVPQTETIKGDPIATRRLLRT